MHRIVWGKKALEISNELNRLGKKISSRESGTMKYALEISNAVDHLVD